MSVLIKGMSMPKNCESCIISRISSTGESLRCGFTYDVVRWDGKEEIPFDCPLVELPPHGDLIDLDEIDYPFGIGEDDGLFLGILDNMPIIIPADKDGE